MACQVSCHFSGTKSVKTARLRIVCAMSCHLSRISYELFTKCVTPNVTHVHFTISSWQVVNTSFLNISKFSPRHGTHYFTWPASPRIPTHTVTSSSLSDTPNCVPWREPFVVPVRGLLIFHLHIPYADKQSAVYQLTLFCVVCVCDSREWWALRFTQSRPRLRILIEPSFLAFAPVLHILELFLLTDQL